jgi:hypothetical protein
MEGDAGASWLRSLRSERDCASPAPIPPVRGGPRSGRVSSTLPNGCTATDLEHGPQSGVLPAAGRCTDFMTPIGNRRRDQVALSVVAQKPDPETLKALNGNITDEFRANAGKVGGDSKAMSCCYSLRRARSPASRGSRRWWCFASMASC